jgi:hypothetical protein
LGTASSTEFRGGDRDPPFDVGDLTFGIGRLGRQADSGDASGQRGDDGSNVS